MEDNEYFITENSPEREITEYIFIDTVPEKADIAVVMGTSKTIPEAARKAADLYVSGVVPLIIVSGGDNARIGKNEAEVISKILIESGVPEGAVLLERKSTNTLENVLYTRALIESGLGFEKIHSIIAVTRNYHARRVLMTFKRHFPNSTTLYAASYESEYYPFNRDNWNKSEAGRKSVYEELAKIKTYLDKGDLAELL